MNERKYQVTLGEKCESFPQGTVFGEVVAKMAEDQADRTLLVKSDGHLMELHREVGKDCTIELVDISEKIGNDTYRRSLCMLLIRSIYQLAGDEHVDKIVLHFSVSGGYYFTVEGDFEISHDFLAKVKTHMMSLVDKKLPIHKKSVSRENAMRIFHEQGMYDKEELFRYRRASRANIYDLEGLKDYYYGFMTWHTGYLKYFDLVPYMEGFVLLLPDHKSPTEVPVFKADRKIFHTQREAEEWGAMLGVDTVGALNSYASKQDIGRLILVSEALQEGKISSIAQKISENKALRFVMIAGPSSSGKTTFSHRLSIQLAAHGLKPHPIAVDNYFVNRVDTPLDENGMRDYECLEAMDIDLFNRDMTALMNGERVELPTYNFISGEREYRGDFLQLGEDDILILEGIHCLNDKFSYSLPREKKFKIYVSALTQLNIDEHNRVPTTDGRLIRRIVRDNRTRGNLAQDTIARWDSVRRGEEKHIFPYQEEADIIFNSALIYEIAVLKPYVEPLLFQISPDSPEYYEANRLLKFLGYFLAIPSDSVPNNSLLREFIGGGCFKV